MPSRTDKQVLEVVFNGITFRCYPESKTDNRYYRANGYWAARGVHTLHREIWKFHNGEIPDGYHIHHIDENPHNNAIENLACIPEKEHRQYHADTLSEERREASRQQINSVRHLASEWHGSEEGREWHRQHALNSNFGKGEPIDYICQVCQTPYQSTKQTNAKFCSNNCKSAYRRLTKADNENRTCAVCGNGFSCNKYTVTKTCSRKCGGAYRKK